MFGISGILALIQCIALFFIPKSPRFMIIKNQEEEVGERTWISSKASSFIVTF